LWIRSRKVKGKKEKGLKTGKYGEERSGNEIKRLEIEK
jgi:hypothetical protein